MIESLIFLVIACIALALVLRALARQNKAADLRMKEKAAKRKENDRAIATSKAERALKANRASEIESVLMFYGDDLDDDMLETLRARLVAYSEGMPESKAY